MDPEVEAHAEVENEETERSQLAVVHGAGLCAYSQAAISRLRWTLSKTECFSRLAGRATCAPWIEEPRCDARAHVPEPLVTVGVYATGDRGLDETERTSHKLVSTPGREILSP